MEIIAAILINLMQGFFTIAPLEGQTINVEEALRAALSTTLCVWHRGIFRYILDEAEIKFMELSQQVPLIHRKG